MDKAYSEGCGFVTNALRNYGRERRMAGRFTPEDFSKDQTQVQETLDKIYNPPEGREDTGPKYDWKQSALPQIEIEMEKIHSGTSDLTKYAIQAAGLIVTTGFSRLQANFTRRNVEEFLMLASQDYGSRARDHFEKLLKGEDNG